jgi:hypothetical protein
VHALDRIVEHIARARELFELDAGADWVTREEANVSDRRHPRYHRPEREAGLVLPFDRNRMQSLLRRRGRGCETADPDCIAVHAVYRSMILEPTRAFALERTAGDCVLRAYQGEEPRQGVEQSLGIVQEDRPPESTSPVEIIAGEPLGFLRSADLREDLNERLPPLAPALRVVRLGGFRVSRACRLEGLGESPLVLGPRHG